MTRVATILCTLGIVLLAGCGDESAGGPVTLDWLIFNEPSGAPVRIAERCSQESGGALRHRIPVPAVVSRAFAAYGR